MAGLLGLAVHRVLSPQWYEVGGQRTKPCLALTPNSLLPRYEEEVSLRATAENEFVALKKASSMEMGSRNTRISGQTHLRETRELSLSVGCADFSISEWEVSKQAGL